MFSVLAKRYSLQRPQERVQDSGKRVAGAKGCKAKRELTLCDWETCKNYFVVEDFTCTDENTEFKF